jgi:hypothetical protein
MSRHGKRADGRALLSTILDNETKEALRVLAAADGRTLSNYVAHQLGQIVRTRKSGAASDADIALLENLRTKASNAIQTRKR